MSGKLSRTVLRRGKGSNPFSLVEFTSNEYIALLKSEDIKISMDSVGRATDNARIERFFRSIKQEKLYIYEYNNVNELRLLVAEYIEFYNYKRIHQSLDYQTPYEFSMAA